MVLSLSLGERKDDMTIKIEDFSLGSRDRSVIPPACQGSVSLTNVMSQEASLLSREVGNHCPRFTDERFCSLLLGCPM